MIVAACVIARYDSYNVCIIAMWQAKAGSGIILVAVNESSRDWAFHHAVLKRATELSPIFIEVHVQQKAA